MSAGHDLWFLDSQQQFAESLSGGADAILLPPETIILKAIYLQHAPHDLHGVPSAFNAPANVLLLRLGPSSDGAPFRSTLVFRSSGATTLGRVVDGRTIAVTLFDVMAYRYQAARAGEWEKDFVGGRPGFFITGASSSALWRVARVERDAFDRHVVTLAPVRLPHAVAVANFDSIEPTLREYLTERFDAFQRALASGAPFDIVDRASNIAHAVVGYCLEAIGRTPRERFADRLLDARSVLEDKSLRDQFRLTDYAYHLAHTIRILHARSHPDQAVKHGRTVRPEVGLGVASDLSEFLVEVGLARY